MRFPEKPYPSFTLVISQAQHSPWFSRYHSPYLVRYHPYSRQIAVAREDLMRTIDYRDEDESIDSTAIRDSDLRTEDRHSTDSEELDAANLSEVIRGPDERHAASRGLRKLRLSTLVIDLALLVRRKCRLATSVKAPAQYPSGELDLTA
ncbi:hypothetical protein PLICRDRAFT_176024 [Plicaturopsis crispa FD-325 SS-3]|nr:hypothetical protein PLICRDRAFT_176024 [Plicaturopsis crispa FD-325 SS-3]